MTRMTVRLPHAVEPCLCFSGGHDRHRSPGRVFPAYVVVFTVPSSRGRLPEAAKLLRRHFTAQRQPRPCSYFTFFWHSTRTKDFWSHSILW